MNNTKIYIERNGIVSGVIRGSISYTLTRHVTNITISGNADELVLPKEFKEIYDGKID